MLLKYNKLPKDWERQTWVEETVRFRNLLMSTKYPLLRSGNGEE